MPKAFTSDGISFIDKTERNVIIDNISQLFWSHIRAKGHFIIVRPYVRPVSSDSVMLPESLRAEDMHHSVAAQVVDIGPTAYTDEKFCGGVAWAQVGDWVFIPRVSGSRVAIKNADGSDTMLRIVREDDVISVISNPADWEIRINATKY